MVEKEQNFEENRENLSDFRKIDHLVSEAHLLADGKEIEETKIWMRQFYKDTGYKKDIEKRINEILEKSLIGWNNAPKDFRERVRSLIGYNALSKYEKRNKIINELRERGLSDEDIALKISSEDPKRAERLQLVVDIEETVFGDSIVDFLDSDEKKFWMKREREYRKEFDFNESSDKVLLEEVIYTEVIIRRIRLNRINQSYAESVKGLRESDLIKNHREALEKLGITRLQRIAADSNVEGNVGELTLHLEEKFGEIQNLKDRKLFKKSIERINDKYRKLTLEEIDEIIEEQTLLREVEKLGELNPIPQAIYTQVEGEIAKQKAHSKDFDDMLGSLG